MMAEDASFTQIERDQESGSRRRSKAEEAAIRKTAEPNLRLRSN